MSKQLSKQEMREQLQRNVYCPNCQSRRVSYLPDDNIFFCNQCKGKFSPDKIEDFVEKTEGDILDERIQYIEKYLGTKFADFKKSKK